MNEKEENKNKNKNKKKILFVCTGNICRSPLAHRLFEKLAAEQKRTDEFHVDSCGTGAWHEGQDADSRVRKIAKDYGWIFHKRSRQIHKDDLHNFDNIYVMDKEHLLCLQNMVKTNFQDLMSKVSLLRSYDMQCRVSSKNIADPYFDGEHAFRKMYVVIERCCKKLLEIL